MTIEDKLKKLIKERYHSVSEFARVCGLPQSTISSVLSRGINTATLSNVLRICEVLHISADALAKNEIVSTVKSDANDIDAIIEKTKHQLLNNKSLMFNGMPANDDSIQALLDAMEIGMEMARKRNKK